MNSKGLASIGACLVTLLLFADAVEALDRAKLRWLRDRPTIRQIEVRRQTVATQESSISDGDVRSAMYSRAVGGLFGALGLQRGRNTKYQRETLARDTLNILALYVRNGYLRARIEHMVEPIRSDDTSRLSEETPARIIVTIDEGPRLRYGATRWPDDVVGRLRFEGNKILSRLHPGRVINLFDIRDAEFRYKEFLANNGLPYAEVAIRPDTAVTDTIIPLSIDVVLDSAVTFGEVQIVGDSIYPEFAARRELTFEPGKQYRRQDIIESQVRLYESGYFSTVQLERDTLSANRYQPDFILRVRERSPRYRSFSVGVSQSRDEDLQLDLTGSYGKRDIEVGRLLLRTEITAEYGLGYFEKIRLSKARFDNFRFTEHRYLWTVTEPWLIRRLPVTLGIEWQPQLRDQILGFETGLVGISLETQRRFGRHIETLLGFEYTWVTIDDLPEELADADITRVETQRRQIRFRLLRDSRDNFFNPRRGTLSRLELDYFGGFLGGDGEFAKALASWTKYQPVWPGWISATRFRVGWAQTFQGDRAIFADEFIFLGGANTVRGFRENRLGPLDSEGDPLGARYTLVVNQEFRWKTIQILNWLPLGLGRIFRTLPLWQTAFIDIGNGFENETEISADNIAVSYGSGLQFLTPAGPIRLDYARVLSRGEFAFQDRLHFTILYAF